MGSIRIAPFLLVLLVAGSASGVELRDAGLVAAGSPVLQNDTGTLLLEVPELDAIGGVVFVPEPGWPWQLGPGLALLSMLHRRRHIGAVFGPRRVPPDPAPGGANEVDVEAQ